MYNQWTKWPSTTARYTNSDYQEGFIVCSFYLSFEHVRHHQSTEELPLLDKEKDTVSFDASYK